MVSPAVDTLVVGDQSDTVLSEYRWWTFQVISVPDAGIVATNVKWALSLGLMSFVQMIVSADGGYFDDETCRLEPIENPFKPKLLPMSPE